ncbi:MAG: DUF1697 domain-containing protein [Gemmatimonadetes bacterium]|nr:DUF1697 domain-containing protein [Gemmatimonadota bacterium]
MALVVFLRGVNVGGHRTFRPTVLANELRHLDVVNIGAAGTFVVRQRVTCTQLRAELVRRLPFDTEIMIVAGRDVIRLMSHASLSERPAEADIVRFVSVLSRRSPFQPPIPMRFPAGGKWLLRQDCREEDRFVLGMYRRDMKVIGYFSALDRLLGTSVTTRNWNTITAIAKVLGAGRR